jgi:hypothetical protein
MGDAYSGGAVLTPEGDSVKVVVLDEFVDANVTKPIRVLKIDVEGMEMAVLRGAVKTINEHRPGVFVEVWDEHSLDYLHGSGATVPQHDTSLNDVTEFMAALGYHQRRKFNTGPVYYFSYGAAGERGSKGRRLPRKKNQSIEQAREALAQNRFQDAIDLCEPILESEKKCRCGGRKVAQAHDIIAVSAWYLGQHGRSRHHARAAMQMFPGDERVTRNFFLIMTCPPPNRADSYEDRQPSDALKGIMAELRTMAESEISYPGGHEGRGIVIVGGGAKYGPGTWALVNVLRKTLGVKTPIEVWHLGPAEMSDAERAAYEGLGVVCVDALEVQKQHPHKLIASDDDELTVLQKVSRGWSLKPYAIAHSAFKEVIFMDSDVVPVSDPTCMFLADEYVDSGAVFWLDNDGAYAIEIEKCFWETAGVTDGPRTGLESGQIVIDKSRCWKQLMIANWITERGDDFCEWLYGDKDAFLTAWLMTGMPFSTPDGSRLEFETRTFRHNDFSGDVLFQHSTGRKFVLGENKAIPGFVHESECLGFLKEYPSQSATL